MIGPACASADPTWLPVHAAQLLAQKHVHILTCPDVCPGLICACAAAAAAPSAAFWFIVVVVAAVLLLLLPLLPVMLLLLRA